MTAFSEAIRRDGVTVTPTAKGRGPGGDGTAERPAGIFVVREGSVTWRPAVNRIVFGGQLVFATALPVLRRSWLRRRVG